MPSKNLHDKPFDESTLTKLEIFEEYAKSWLPTFCNQPNRTVCFFDFFAGTGYDKKNIPGSPFRILRVIKQYLSLIIKNNITVKVYLNEFDGTKFHILNQAWELHLEQDKGLANIIKYEIYNKDFDVLFEQLLPSIAKFPSLVFLDQNGVKFASDKYFSSLEKLNQTDFLFFISSSYIKRFGQTAEFQKHLSIDMDKLRQNPYRFIHKDVVNALRNKLPEGSRLKLYPFSIKKGTNIYGLVFGAKHPFAVDKFLNVVWKKNQINGDANFDINEEKVIPQRQLSLFPEPAKFTKIQKFQQLLEDIIKVAGEITNIELYLFSLEHGHISTHAKEHLQLLKKDRIIDYDCVSPKVNYDAYKKNDVLRIRLITNNIS